MKKYPLYGTFLLMSFLMLSLGACSDKPDNPQPSQQEGNDYKFVGKAVGNFEKEEWFPGGELGTTMNTVKSSY